MQDLEALSKMVPTKEEEAKLIGYKGDTFDLSSAEKLVSTMLKIPFAFRRIEAMLYRETFEDEVLHLRKSFSMLEVYKKTRSRAKIVIMLISLENYGDCFIVLGGMQGAPVEPALPQAA